MKRVCLATLTTLLCVLVQAAPFFTGAYTWHYINESQNADYSSLRNWLVDGGFNAINLSIHENSVTTLGGVLQTFGNDARVVLSDCNWDPSSGTVGIHKLSYGNYLKMEAEYMYAFDSTGVFTPDLLTTTLDPTGVGDVYNYVFAHDESCGYRTDQGAHSNQYTWVCDEGLGHDAGLALSNPRFRWKKPTHIYPRSIGSDLKFNRAQIPENRLYLTVAMKFDSLAIGEEVATIKLKALKNLPNFTPYQDYINNSGLSDPNNYYEFVLHPVNSEVGTTIYNNPFP